MLELERTFLIKELPPNLKNYPVKEIIDLYLPAEVEHPNLRLRKNGDKFEMTKKTPTNQGDRSRQVEQTINLTAAEFAVLQNTPAKKVRKLRYLYDCAGQPAEVDVFQEELQGLVLVDFEFDTEEAKNNFSMPTWCLVEVTQENFLAGGMLCGKKYADLQNQLVKFNYQPLLD